MVEDALGKHVPQKMTEEEQMHAHIIKLLDKEDRHALFELLFKITKENKWEAANIMGISKSATCHIFDERRKEPYAPSPETTTKIFAYLAKMATWMHNNPKGRVDEFAVAWSEIIQKLKSELILDEHIVSLYSDQEVHSP